MGAGRILLLFVGTAASVGGATVLWVSSLTPRDVPFVAPVHPRLVQRQTPVVATPLPKPRVVVKKVKHAHHVAPKPAPVATPVVVPQVTPVVRHVTPPPPPSKPKPKPVVPPAPTPAPAPAPVPVPPPAPATPVPAPVVTAAAPPVETTTASPPPAPPAPPPTTTTDDNTKPGNGYGDQNHEHTGPPGQEKKDK